VRAVEGATLFSGRLTVSADRMRSLALALGGSVEESPAASVVPFFGPTVAGERLVVEGIGLDLSRALLGSQSYEWTRPFRSGEEVDVTVRVERAWEKNSTEFAVVASEFKEPSGELIQRQTTTFIERAPG
jgi:acyl dehydratase